MKSEFKSKGEQAMNTDNLFFPEFPKNKIGLQRGSILQANYDGVLGIKKGGKFPIGFDGEYIRCGGCAWDVDSIENEVKEGLWIVTGEVADLSDTRIARIFIEKIEKREVSIIQ